MATLLLKPKYAVTLTVEKRRHLYDVVVPLSYGDVNRRDLGNTFRFPGVTGQLDVIAKPALIPWAKNEALASVEAALVKRLEGQLHREVPLTKLWIDDVISEAKKRPEKIKDDAAEHGTDVHAIIDKLIHGETVTYPEAYGPAVQAFQEWWKNSGIELVMGDTKVASLVYKYGGSLDALGRREGQFIILDWKTSNGIYPEMALQVSAYAQAFYETYGIYCQEGIIVRFGKKLPIDFETKTIADLEESFQAFLSAKRLKESLSVPHFLEAKFAQNQR